MKLLLGTSNEGKIRHYKKFLSNANLELVTLKDVGITDEPEETGMTLEENATLKAKFYYEKSGLPTLADDAGFEIPALNNFPGVQSRRIDGITRTDKEILDIIIDRMKDLKSQDRAARMKVALALALDKDDIKIATGEITGIVPEKPYEKLEDYFPYRSLLFIPQLNKWFYDLTEDEENMLGYRKAAAEKIKQYLL